MERSPQELETWMWLLSGAGQDALEHAHDLRDAGTSDLRISELLRQTLTADQAAVVQTQVTLREKASAKFPDARNLFFTREGLEQASSASIADHRATRFQDAARVTDLCCGIGGDLMGLAGETTADLAAVDIDPVHLMLATVNARLLHPDRIVIPLEDDVRNVSLSGFDHAFIDPARRDARGRKKGYESEPPLDWVLELGARVRGLGVKCAPGIPHEIIPDGWELETLALGYDLKEAVLWSPGMSTLPDDRPRASATVIDQHGVFTYSARSSETCDVRPPVAGNWLYDLNPAVTNAGLVSSFAADHGLRLIDDQIGFLVGDNEMQTPFARPYRIVEVMPWHEKRVKSRLGDLGAGPVDVRRRGLAGDVDAIAKRLRGSGDTPFFVAMTRVDNEPTAIICER